MGHLVGTNGFKTAFWGCVGGVGADGAHMGPWLGPWLAPCSAKQGPGQGHVGQQMGYIRLPLGGFRVMLGRRWAMWSGQMVSTLHFGVVLGLHSGQWGQTGAMSGPYWVHVGPHMGYVGLIWGHFGLYYLSSLAAATLQGKHAVSCFGFPPNTSPMQDSCSQCSAFCSITWLTRICRCTW